MNMITKFELTSEQVKMFDKWRKKSKTPEKSKTLGTWAANFSFTFHSNGIGDSVIVRIC